MPTHCSQRSILVFALALVHCAGTQRAPQTASAPRPSLNAFETALYDAEEATPDERSPRLWPIASPNSRLTWNDAAGQRRVLMVTWTDWNGYDLYVGEDMPLARELWVTAVPEVRDFCGHLDASSDALTTRLRQYLGLRPDSRKDRFVEVWVNPADLFRPCPDPEIDDAACEVDFPATASAEHRAWFTQLRTGSYGPEGYPWTRLGYTYDWSRVHGMGASEFVVRAHATVGIRAITPTAAYCGPGDVTPPATTTALLPAP